VVWQKLGRVYCPDGTSDWAKVGFMTPVPLQISRDVIRVFGGLRDSSGISRIGWIDVARDDPTAVLAVSETPCLDLGAPGMFDDNGLILGDLLWMPDGSLRMYYVGFQLVEKAKFLAYTGVAVSNDGGNSFARMQPTPVLDRAPNALFINALHSISATEGGYRAWISCGIGWQEIAGKEYPKYNCWTLTSPDGLKFDMTGATQTIDVQGEEYRIGRPRANQLADGTWEMRVSSDNLSKQYVCHLATSQDGVIWERSDVEELPRGAQGTWDGEMTCYPARIDTDQGESYLFYNGNNMGETGVGVAMLSSAK
jgi:hypothetical protein